MAVDILLLNLIRVQAIQTVIDIYMKQCIGNMDLFINLYLDIHPCLLLGMECFVFHYS